MVGKVIYLVFLMLCLACASAKADEFENCGGAGFQCLPELGICRVYCQWPEYCFWLACEQPDPE